MKMSRFWLIFSAAGPLPISLSYGIATNLILPNLLDINPLDGNLVHVFRAIIGLCLATIVLWLLGAIRCGALMRPALISDIVFMSGLAAGWLLSLPVDGWPSPMLTVYIVAELVFAAWGVMGLRRVDSMHSEPKLEHEDVRQASC